MQKLWMVEFAAAITRTCNYQLPNGLTQTETETRLEWVPWLDDEGQVIVGCRELIEAHVIVLDEKYPSSFRAVEV